MVNSLAIQTSGYENPKMNLQQMRYFCAVVDNHFNLTGAADSLHTSQPGVSKQLHLLERELGIDLLLRSGHRIRGLTSQGATAHQIARRMLREVNNLKMLGADFANENAGEFIVAATHIHERYWLLPVILKFGKAFPCVRFRLQRGSPTQVLEMVASGEAHIGISTITEESRDEVLTLPCHELHRSILLPKSHPLHRKKKISLADLAIYPLIINSSIFSGGWSVLRLFEANGYKPEVVLNIPDTEVIKSCVEQGLGIAILPTKVYDAKKDRAISAVNASHIFEPMRSCVLIQQNYYLRAYAFEFIRMFAPQWTREATEKAMLAPQ